MSELLSYAPEHDVRNYRKLWNTPVEFKQAERERLDAYTDMQIQTLLAERFNVLTSTFYYDMKEGQLWGQDMNEPAIDSFKRGRDLRLVTGNPIDRPREAAEIEGFEKIEQMLKDGKDVLSISPRGEAGSTYQHNFYDIFRWRDGKIEVKRYSSALEIFNYQEKLGVEHKDAADFLANPIDISTKFESSDQVHEYLHVDHEFVSTEVFNNVILPPTRPFRLGYLEAMYDGRTEEAMLHLNAAINMSDETLELYENRQEGELYVANEAYSLAALNRLGNQEVRKVSTGCGASGGYDVSQKSSEKMNPWRVSEFGKSDAECGSCGRSTEDDHYHCPGCGGSYESERNKSAGSRTKVCGKQSGDGYPCGFKFGC